MAYHEPWIGQWDATKAGFLCPSLNIFPLVWLQGWAGADQGGSGKLSARHHTLVSNTYKYLNCTKSTNDIYRSFPCFYRTFVAFILFYLLLFHLYFNLVLIAHVNKK